MSNIKWVKLKDGKNMYSSLNCTGCGDSRNLDRDPIVCSCGYEDFYADQSVVRDLLETRTKNLACHCCPTELSDERVCMFPNDQGWKMLGVAGRWWMTIKCPQCGYVNSFDKFCIIR